MKNPNLPLVHIRAARTADVSALLLMIAHLAAHHGDTATTTVEALQEDVFASPPWVSVLVAEGDTGLVGYAILCPLYRAQYGQRGIDLHHLFVIPEKRREGVGRSLIEAAIAQARSSRCDHLVIGATPDNLRAQAYYEALGFTRSELRGVRFTQRLS